MNRNGIGEAIQWRNSLGSNELRGEGVVLVSLHKCQGVIMSNRLRSVAIRSKGCKHKHGTSCCGLALTTSGQEVQVVDCKVTFLGSWVANQTVD